MKRSTKKILVLFLGAAAAVVAVWVIDAIALAVLHAMQLSGDQIAMWQPRILFASFAIVLVATCLLLEVLVKTKRKGERSRTDGEPDEA